MLIILLFFCVIYFTYMRLISILIIFCSFSLERMLAKQDKQKWFYCKWLPYYNQMIFVAGNLLFVKCISWSQNDYNWTLLHHLTESHILLIQHTRTFFYLLSISLMICKSTGLLLNFETMLPILIAHHIAAAAAVAPEYTRHRSLPEKYLQKSKR